MAADTELRAVTVALVTNEKEVVTFSFSGSWTEQEFAFLRNKLPGYRAAGTYRPNDVTLRNGDGPARLLAGIAMSSELFDVLGARPAIGQNFKAGDDAIGAIRVALGLSGARVVRHIVVHAAALVALGVLFGGIITMTMSHLLSSLLFGVSGVDALAFAGASAAVLGTGLLAAFLPARRAGTVDPAIVLREQ